MATELLTLDQPKIQGYKAFMILLSDLLQARFEQPAARTVATGIERGLLTGEDGFAPLADAIGETALRRLGRLNCRKRGDAIRFANSRGMRSTAHKIRMRDTDTLLPMV